MCGNNRAATFVSDSFMRSYQLQLKLWIIGFCGLGFYWIATPAVAKETAVETETVDTPRSGHDCYDLTTEQPDSLGEFRGAALETAVAAARSIPRTETKVSGLTQLSEAYACLGQVELATMLAEEAIALTPEIENVVSRSQRIVEIARLYGNQLNEPARKDELLLTAIAQVAALPDTSSADSSNASDDSALTAQLAEQGAVIYEVMFQYASNRNYQKMRDIVDLIEDETLKEQTIMSASGLLMSLVTDESRAQIVALFPELPEIATYEAPEHSPLQNWLLQIDLINPELIAAEDRAAMDALIASQISTIESFSDVSAQLYSYAILSKELSAHGQTDYAMQLLSLALQKKEDLDSYRLPVEVVGYGAYEDNIYSLLGSAFIAAGEFETGISFAKEITDPAARFRVLFPMARTSIEYGHSTDKSVALLVEAEQAARAFVEPIHFLTAVVYAYLDIEEFENARRLTQEAVALLEQAEGDNVDRYARHVVLVLIELDSQIGLDNPDQIGEIIITIESPAVLVELTTTLALKGYEDMAYQVSSNIVSPYNRAYVAASVAEAHRHSDRLEQAYALSAMAIEILQSDAFYEDANSIEIVDYYRESSPNASEEELYLIISESSITGIIDLLEGDLARQRSLIQLVEDDDLRESLLANLSPDDEMINEDLPPATAPEEDWPMVASESASEGKFLQAVEAVAMMENPEAQMRSLINIAKCYADSTTELDTETDLLLHEIQQRTL